MNCLLPKSFKFQQAKDLIRIGKDNDGGYLISKKDLLKSDFLLSLGICDDWSFEKDFINKNKIPLHAYDALLDYKFLRNLDISIVDKIKKIFSYNNFFKGTNIHFRKYIGINNNKEGFYTLSSVLKDLEFKAIFLKIDIEGSDLEVLKTINLDEIKLDLLMIEASDFDKEGRYEIINYLQSKNY